MKQTVSFFHKSGGESEYITLEIYGTSFLEAGGFRIRGSNTLVLSIPLYREWDRISGDNIRQKLFIAGLPEVQRHLVNDFLLMP